MGKFGPMRRLDQPLSRRDTDPTGIIFFPTLPLSIIPGERDETGKKL